MKTRDHSSKKSWVWLLRSEFRLLLRHLVQFKVPSAVVKRDQSFCFPVCSCLIVWLQISESENQHRQKPISKPQLLNCLSCQKYVVLVVQFLLLHYFPCSRRHHCGFLRVNLGNFPISWINNFNGIPTRLSSDYFLMYVAIARHFLCRFNFSSHIDFDCFTFTTTALNMYVVSNGGSVLLRMLLPIDIVGKQNGIKSVLFRNQTPFLVICPLVLL